MTGARLRHLLSTGLGSLALVAMGSVQAQTMPEYPAPVMPAGPISAPGSRGSEEPVVSWAAHWPGECWPSRSRGR